MQFKIHRFKEVGSTNNKAKELATEGTVVIADFQTHGRGRFNRKWSSELGGIYMSIVLKPTDNLQLLTFMTAIAVQYAIKKACKIDAKVKWPNDLLVNQQKLCGILSEGVIGQENTVVVGIGINLKNTLPDELEEDATSLSELGVDIDKNIIVDKILEEFNDIYSWQKEKVIEEWKKLTDTLNRRVKIKAMDNEFTGEAIDINNDCSLIIKTDEGVKEVIVEGDIDYIN